MTVRGIYLPYLWITLEFFISFSQQFMNFENNFWMTSFLFIIILMCFDYTLH